jgi:phosphonatase-like hydrolase
MEIALIVFDMAGTTVRDDDAVNLSLQAALADARVAASRDDINAVMGMPKPQAIHLLLARYRGQAAATEGIVADVHADFMARMLRHYQDGAGVRECDGATETFEWCHALGIKAALDTGFNRPIADAIIRRLGWTRAGLLDATITSDEVPRGRPFPDMIHGLMALTGVSDPARIAKVGDTPVDIAQGHAAGCRLVVAVTSGSHTAAELAPHNPTHLVADLRELRELVMRSETEAA